MQSGMPLLVSVLLLARLMSPRMHLPRVRTASINNRTRGTMKNLIAAIAITLALAFPAFAQMISGEEFAKLEVKALAQNSTVKAMPLSDDFAKAALKAIFA